MFKGSLPALITPFKNGEVDTKAFQEFVEWQIAEGSHGLVPCGTTGESPTLSHEEHKLVVELCIEAAAGRVPVIAGAGSNSTLEAIDLAKHAKSAGADAVLVVAPYYNKPSQEGLFRHFEAINNAVEIPIIVYNIPPRSIVDIQPITMARIAKLANVVGVKDATNDLARPLREKNLIGPDWCMLSGEDGTAIAYLAQGGSGCISVTANVAPRLCSMMQEAWQQGAMDRVRELNESLMPLHDAIFCEPSPAPAKYGVSLLGKASDKVRLPLAEASGVARGRMEDAMKALKII
ncbi:MAG: 4-hydroxy-tetrahydrodipicolinate synthase [Rhodospirillales bacterium]|jgi:4-hydroxy-tetrahydrodipicolinate synthase